MGIISETGSGVTLLKKGDRVVLPFNVADGRCLNCEEGNTAFCTGVNPGFAGGGTDSVISSRRPIDLMPSAYGYVAMGPYAGGQVRATKLGPATALQIIWTILTHQLMVTLISINYHRRNTYASLSPILMPSPSRQVLRTKPLSLSLQISSQRAGMVSRSQTSGPGRPWRFSVLGQSA